MSTTVHTTAGSKSQLRGMMYAYSPTILLLMKKLLLSLGLAALLLPILAVAQENQPPASTYCPHLTRDLKLGSRDSTTGGQVSELQRFLSDWYDLNPDDYVTGYFGRLTRDNVMRFQREQGIMPVSGYVGPLTRAAIARVCSGTTPPPTSPTCTLSANPPSITLGQSSLLSWSSTNAAQGYISNIGTVAANGSQSISPLLTTIYYGTFWGQGGTASCNTTVSVALPAGDGFGARLDASVSASGLIATLHVSPIEIGYCSTAGDQGSISWGDGSTTAAGGPGSLWGVQCSTTSGTFTLTHTYATAGTYTIVITLNGYTKTVIVTVAAPGQICEHANPPDGCSWQKGATCAEDRLICQTSFNSCVTPWGNQTYGHGAWAPDQPYFTNGVVTGTVYIPWYHHCESGTWVTYHCPYPLNNYGSCVKQEKPTVGAACTLDGVIVGHGTIRKFYSQRTAANDSQCQTYSIDRKCENGVLSGSSAYQYASCTAQTSQPSITITITAPPSGTSVARGSMLNIAWTSQNAPYGNSYVAFAIAGQGIGSLPTTGSYNWTIPASVPIGQTSLVVNLVQQSPAAVLASSQIPITVTSGTTASVGSCTYKGQTYAEGQTVAVILRVGESATNLTCDNGVWVRSFGTMDAGANVCDGPMFESTRTDLGCGSYSLKALIAVMPRHGSAPLTVQATTEVAVHPYGCPAYSFSWGDGTTESLPQRQCNDMTDRDIRTHTYTAPGSYTINYTDNGGKSNSANIRVDSGTALAPQSTQLASAYTALLGALQSILKLLGQ